MRHDNLLKRRHGLFKLDNNSNQFDHDCLLEAINNYNEIIDDYKKKEPLYGNVNALATKYYLRQAELIFGNKILPQLKSVKEEFNNFSSREKVKLRKTIGNFFTIDPAYWTFQNLDAAGEERSVFFRSFDPETGIVTFSSRTGGDDDDESAVYTVEELLVAIHDNSHIPKMPNDAPSSPSLP